MQRLWWSVLFLAIAVNPVSAHFVFLVPAESGKSAQLVFSEGLEADTFVPVKKIAQTQLFLKGSKNATPLKMVLKDNAYVVALPGKKARVVGGVCIYGVLTKGADPFLLAYYPKAVIGNASKEEAGTRFSRLLFEILVSGNQGQVLFQGKPAAESEVIITPPGDARRIKTTTDKNGNFTFELPSTKGLLHIRARHVENKAGKLKGEAYKQAKHYATLVISTNVLQSVSGSGDRQANSAASKLLKEARQARMEWENFPGFSANIQVNHNGMSQRGQIVVSGAGRVDVKGIDNPKTKMWVRKQVSQIVMHRISNAAERDTPCAFADDVKDHPLGRKIVVLNDELHSSYRIRDRQIIEVNRSMKGIRFTITVLHNYETPNKKFLPASYVVNTWASKGGQLVSSSSHHHTWTKVGQYDLPASLLIANAAPEGDDSASSHHVLDSWSLHLSGHELLPRK